MAAKKMAYQGDVSQHWNGVAGIGGIGINVCQVGGMNDPKVFRLVGQGGLIKGLPIRDDDVGVGNRNRDDSSANDWNFKTIPVPVTDLQYARVDGVFGGTLGQNFLRQRAPLNFRVGQSVRRLRRRASSKKQNQRGQNSA